jgi:macrophage erythroblast attacher
MITKMRGVKRKLAACADEEALLTRQSEARIVHLRELYGMHSVEDVQYEAWSRKRLDRLLVDYLLRSGYNASAGELAKERGVEDLVDVEAFVQMSRVRESLKGGSVQEALAWCQDKKKELRKMEVSFSIFFYIVPSPPSHISTSFQRSRSHGRFVTNLLSHL